jgi:predicted aminopeptidase
MRKKIVSIGLLALLLLLLWHHRLVFYGLSQAYGQLSIIFKTRPVTEVLQDPEVADSIKQKIVLINEIRQFAFDSLGIIPNKNYTSFYDQQGKPILWVVTACPPFELKAYEWTFPVLGSFSYKGFFDYTKAEKEEQALKAQGLDTEIGEVAAWSTLGWLRDPILSGMLRRKPGSLANLIIHELTHGTLYVKDNVDFNENLASFVGDFGAKKFLIQKYGKDSKEYLEYEKGLQINQNYSELVLRFTRQLDSLYRSFPTDLPIQEKSEQKNNFLRQAKDSLRQYLVDVNAYMPRHEKEFATLNNTYFMEFVTYRSQQNIFEEEFTNRFQSDFPAYMHYLKNKYPSL